MSKFSRDPVTLQKSSTLSVERKYTVHVEKLHTGDLFHYETKAASVCAVLLKMLIVALWLFFPLCSQTEITPVILSDKRLKTTNNLQGLWTFSCRVITLLILQLLNACWSVCMIMTTVVLSFLLKVWGNWFGQKSPHETVFVCCSLRHVCHTVAAVGWNRQQWLLSF